MHLAYSVDRGDPLVRGECLLGVEILGGLPNTSGSSIKLRKTKKTVRK